MNQPAKVQTDFRDVYPCCTNCTQPKGPNKDFLFYIHRAISMFPWHHVLLLSMAAGCGLRQADPCCLNASYWKQPLSHASTSSFSTSTLHSNTAASLTSVECFVYRLWLLCSNLPEGTDGDWCFSLTSLKLYYTWFQIAYFCTKHLIF